MASHNHAKKVCRLFHQDKAVQAGFSSLKNGIIRGNFPTWSSVYYTCDSLVVLALNRNWPNWGSYVSSQELDAMVCSLTDGLKNSLGVDKCRLG